MTKILQFLERLRTSYEVFFILQFNTRRRRHRMTDISDLLKSTMQNENCSSFCAFLLVTEGEKDVHILQPKPIEEISRRLCDKSNIKSDRF